MTGFTSRRGLGARVVLVAAVLAVAIAPLAGFAATPPVLVNSSFINSWAGPTALLPHCAAPCAPSVPNNPEFHNPDGSRKYLASDPPWQWSDGEVQFLLTRWDQQICDGTVTGDIAPAWSVIEYDHPIAPGDGLAVLGTVSVEDFSTQERDTLVRFTVADPAYPHGLAAGRTVYSGNAIQGGGAPYTLSLTVYPRDFNGVCDTASPTTLTQIIGVDRFIPRAPEITAPAGLATITGNRNIGNGCKQFPALPTPDPDELGVCVDRVNVAAPQQGTVLVEGEAQDQYTLPWATTPSPFKRLETSGVRAVVVRLYAAESIGNCGSTDIGFCPGGFIKSYQIDNAACGTGTYPIPAGATIPQCSQSFTYSVDITADLTPGDWYAVDAVVIDLANFRSPVDPTQPNNPDNKNEGPESFSRAFLFLG